jgi:diguanylate cyclase (GGDEF)-like protein
MNLKPWNKDASIIIGLALALRRTRKRSVLAYAIALLLVGSASLLQWQLEEQYAGAPFLTIYPAVILATVVGGLGPGLFSAILAGASQFGIFIPNFHWTAVASYSFDATICVALIVLINRTMDTLWTNDALTGLANRTLLSEQLERVLQHIPPGQRIAVLYLDLHNLNRVNETLGHPVADKLLRGVAKRLRGCVRGVDFVARLDGDEFAIIQAELEHPDDAAKLAVRAREALREPFVLDGHEVMIDVSVGIAVAPDDATDVNELLKAADIALFEAKSAGRGNYCFYRPEMNESMQRRIKLERELQALANGEFELFYQPIFSLKEGRIRSV